MANKIPSFLLDRSASGSIKQGTGKVRMPFLERGIDHLASVIKEGYAQWEFSSRNGFFQKVDARVKVLFLLFFVLIVSLKNNVLTEIYIWIFVFMLTLLSRLNILRVYKKVFLLGFLFGCLIALPSAFNVITKGEIVLPVATLSRSYTFWIYHIPAEIGMTREGIYGVALITMRVINSLSLSFLVLYTTPFHQVVRALKVLKVPDSFLIIITLCYKYIFIFAKTVEEMHLAKKSRIIRQPNRTEAREWIVGRMALMFRKARLRCEEVFKGMIVRGFSDSIHFYGFGKLGMADWFTAVFLLFAAILFLLV